jgi:hypothetical protein
MKTIQLTHPHGAFLASLKQVVKWTFWTITAFAALAYAGFLSLIILL